MVRMEAKLRVLTSSCHLLIVISGFSTFFA